MKVREGFILRKLPDMNLVMPTGANAKGFRKTIVLNDTAAFLFELFQNNETEEAAVLRLMEVCSIDEKTAENAVRNAVQSFREAGLAVD